MTSSPKLNDFMGNILESDSSTDSETIELRTEGDGMEMENAESTKAVSNQRPEVQTQPLKTLKNSGSIPNLATPVRQGSVHPVLKSKIKIKNSPRELPPSEDLILLKPIRIGETPVVPESVDTPPVNIVAQPNKKQREPKFVPYEPYAGAVRPMGTSISSRRGSSASLPAFISPKKTTQIPSPTQQAHQPLESSNITLLRERIRISEKDITELRVENSRLKRLLVDSLSGSQPSPTDQTGGRMKESMDNLSDEIEVWRSKFLSSCVLVEQLTAEKEDLLNSTSKASELFKELKASVDLTPELYEKIRDWISLEEKGRVLRSENSFSSVEDDF